MRFCHNLHHIAPLLELKVTQLARHINYTLITIVCHIFNGLEEF